MDVKLIGGTVTAIAVGSILLCVLGGLTRRGWSAGAWAVLLAVAVAPLAADKPLLGERPQWRATDTDRADAVQRIILSAAPLAMAAAALAGRRVPAWSRGIVAVVGPAAVIYWVLTAYPGSALTGWPTRLATPAVASLIVWLLIEPLAARRPTGVAAPWVCGCLAAGVGLLNLFSTATSPGWVAVAIGGVIGGTFLVAATGRGPSFAGGPVAVIVGLLVCAVMAHRLGGGEVPIWQWALLAAAPMLAWVVEIRPMRDWRPWLREPLRMSLVAVPIVVAVVPAHRQWVLEQQAETGGGAGWSMVWSGGFSGG